MPHDHQKELDSIISEMRLDGGAKGGPPSHPGSKNTSRRSHGRRGRRPRPQILYSRFAPSVHAPQFNLRENAGIDVWAHGPVEWFALGTSGTWEAVVSTGLAFQLPEGVHLMVAGRSGNAVKRDIIPFYGILDSSYRGEIKIKLLTHRPEVATTQLDTSVPIAQLVFLNYAGINLLRSEIREVDYEELTATERGSKGFGQTSGVV